MLKPCIDLKILVKAILVPRSSPLCPTGHPSRFRIEKPVLTNSWPLRVHLT